MSRDTKVVTSTGQKSKHQKLDEGGAARLPHTPRRAPGFPSHPPGPRAPGPGRSGQLQVDVGEDAGGDGEGDSRVDKDGEVREMVEVAALVPGGRLLLGRGAHRGLGGLPGAGPLRPPAGAPTGPPASRRRRPGRAGRGRLFRGGLVEQAPGVVGGVRAGGRGGPGLAREERGRHGRGARGVAGRNAVGGGRAARRLCPRRGGDRSAARLPRLLPAPRPRPGPALRPAACSHGNRARGAGPGVRAAGGDPGREEGARRRPGPQLRAELHRGRICLFKRNLLRVFLFLFFFIYNLVHEKTNT